jgi:hypothetical protein
MAGSSIAESTKTLYSGQNGGVKKVTLGCITDATAGTIDIYLSVGLTKHLNGWRLYQAITYPGVANPAADTDILFKELAVEVSFDAGSAAFIVGEPISDASGATAVVKAVHLTSGTWAGGDAAGSLQLAKWNQTAFTNNDVLSGTSQGGSTAGAAVVAGASAVAGRTLTILTGTDLIDAATPNIITPTAQEAGEMYLPIMDDDFTYLVDVDNAGNSKQFVMDLYFLQ